MSLEENISKLSEQVIQERNFINHFLPFRNKGHTFDYGVIAGSLLGSLLNRRVKESYSIERFRNDCLAKIKTKLHDQFALDEIDTLYFSGNGVYQISAELLMFKPIEKSVAGDSHLSKLFESFLKDGSSTIISGLHSNLTFIEEEILTEFRAHLDETVTTATEYPYLPFVRENFVTDLGFLMSRPGYFQQNINSFLSLYNFLYCSQLARNISDIDREPFSKPQYFILDTERASLERTKVLESYRELKAQAASLFPLLSILEYFNQPQNKEACKYPLWMIARHIEDSTDEQKECFERDLVEFIKNYRNKRGLGQIENYPKTPAELVKLFAKSARDVFNVRGTSQFTVNNRYVSAFEEDVASHFIQTRGRAGRVLTLNQDFILLITNLAIGRSEQLQFQQLLVELKKRGIWFDQPSEQALIRFYERVGNVERMSDSGDAVYVRSTI